jgi:hypothetical protein
MKTNKPWVSKAVQEVWDCKEAMYREVAHLPTGEALRAMFDKAHETVERMRRSGLLPRSGVPRIAAEPLTSYGIRRQRACRRSSKG